MINYLVQNYGIFNIYSQKKIKNNFVAICGLFNETTHRKNIIQANGFKIFIRARLKAAKIRYRVASEDISIINQILEIYL